MKYVLLLLLIGALLPACKRKPSGVDLNVDPEFKAATAAVEEFLHQHGVTNAETIDVGVDHDEFVFRFFGSGTNVQVVVFTRGDRTIRFRSDIR